MKKITSIFLSLIFLVSAMGMTINSHFCGTKLQSVGLTEQHCCCKEGSMPKGCCKNEVTFIKITDHYSPSSQFHVEKADADPVILNFVFVPSITSNSFFFSFNDHSPPPKFADRVIAFHSILV